jgi:diaminopimelate epimerase
MEQNAFVKSHGLGNDYFVLDEQAINFQLTEKNIQLLCDVHYGIGSDGILLKTASSNADFGLKIFNPDGSEAEKSGNGLRIFSKYLFDYGFAKQRSFSIETLAGIVKADVIAVENNKATMIQVDMGKATFIAKDIPVKTTETEYFGKPLLAGDKEFNVYCVSVGNPHCVIVKNEICKEETLTYGPLIENHNLFPNRINVQFVRVIANDLIEMEIWERGAGYTLASGSSSCAVAAVVKKLGLTKENVTLKMPGGTLQITIDKDWNIRMAGEVKEIARGILSEELIKNLK